MCDFFLLHIEFIINLLKIFFRRRFTDFKAFLISESVANFHRFQLNLLTSRRYWFSL
jgi:hypothetical protein